MNYQIIFHDGKSMDITDVQKEVIYKLSCNNNIKGVDINGEYIFFSSISRIIKSNNYQEYPQLPTINETIGYFTKEKRKRALMCMINGFKKHFIGRDIPSVSQKMLDNMLKRYASNN
jgi:hypothetical protein